MDGVEDATAGDEGHMRVVRRATSACMKRGTAVPAVLAPPGG